jgi:hypothetical protein
MHFWFVSIEMIEKLSYLIMNKSCECNICDVVSSEDEDIINGKNYEKKTILAK